MPMKRMSNVKFFAFLMIFSLIVFPKNIFANSIFEDVSQAIYNQIATESPDLDYKAFRTGLVGYVKLRTEARLSNEKHYLTIIDYSKSANKERMYIIDLKGRKLLLKTLVSHGKNTGDEFAKSFGNDESSHMSSLGFFITGQTYIGSKGYSLKLNGLENGINDRVFERGVVIHGADYVSFDFIKNNGRLGRSFGCPAVPTNLNDYICNLLSNRTCVFAYYPDKTYFQHSALSQGTPNINGAEAI